MSASVSVLLKNACPTIGEGPHWNEKTKTLLYVDINTGEVHSFNTVTGQDSKIVLGNIAGGPGTGTTVGFVVPRAAGGYVVGANRSVSILDWENAQLTAIATVEDGTENRMNDGKCDPTGRLWAGSMGPEKTPGVPVPHLGSLYSLENDRSMAKRLSPTSISNGLAWTKDNNTMFFIDSGPRQVYAFDFDMDSGNISNKRVLADWSGTDVMDMGYPDGMTIDQEGKLWVASYLGAKVVRLDPETGVVLQQVDIPARRITSCCFGGPNFEDLFVTSARFAASEEELGAYPLAGSVFKVSGIGVKGSPATEYGG